MTEIPMTHDIREKIKYNIKNRLDISQLIKDRTIKNENLSYAIIKELNRINTDISNCNFSQAQIGEEGKIVSIINTRMYNCNFDGAIFIGKAWMRSCFAQNCNFKNADVSNVDYQHSDFRGSSFCNAVIRISTKSGIGCKFPKEMFYDLTKGWDMNIKVIE